MEIRSSDQEIPSLAGRPRDKVRALGTGANPTAMQDLTSVATALATEGARTAMQRINERSA